MFHGVARCSTGEATEAEEAAGGSTEVKHVLDALDALIVDPQNSKDLHEISRSCNNNFSFL